MPKAFVFKGFRFLFLFKNEKNEKATVFHWLFFRLPMEMRADAVRFSADFFMLSDAYFYD